MAVTCGRHQVSTAKAHLLGDHFGPWGKQIKWAGSRVPGGCCCSQEPPKHGALLGPYEALAPHTCLICLKPSGGTLEKMLHSGLARIWKAMAQW